MSYSHITYMEAIAKNLKEIGHNANSRRFYRVSSIVALDELAQKTRTIRGPLLVAEDTRQGRYLDGTSDNVVDRQSYSYMLLDLAAQDKIDRRMQVVSQMASLQGKIAGLMFRHKTLGQHGLRDLEMGSFAYQSVGPLLDGLNGLLVSFTILNGTTAKYNASDWTLQF